MYFIAGAGRGRGRGRGRGGRGRPRRTGGPTTAPIASCDRVDSSEEEWDVVSITL